MRILYLSADVVPAPKGAGVRIARTVEALAALGHDVRLLSAAGPEDARLASVQHETVSLAQPNFLARMMAWRRAAAEWLDGAQGELVQFRSSWEGLPALAWAARRQARAIFEAHGFSSLELPYHYPGLYAKPQLLEKLLGEEQAVLARADLLVTHSLTGRRYLLQRGVPPRRIALLPNAVDGELFSPVARPPLDEDPARLLYVGTLAPWQGLLPLLAALARFRTNAEVQLQLIGPLKGPWRRQLERSARELRVHHLLQLSVATPQGNLVPALRSAHLCVAPLPADARNIVQGCCPLKVLEYMAVGRPILATNIPPLLELLEHGRTAYLVAPDQPEALAAGIRWLLDHPNEREALGRAARQVALEIFSPAQFLARLDQALRQLEALEPGCA